MKNNLLSNETERSGTGMLNISIDPKGKGDFFFFFNLVSKQKYIVNRNIILPFVVYSYFGNVLNYRVKINVSV